MATAVPSESPDAATRADSAADPFEMEGTEAAPIARTEIANARVAAAVGQYFGLVWRALRRLGVREALADDAAQQVFLIFTRRLENIRSGSERAFLLSSAVRVASNARRNIARLREDPLLEEPGHRPQDQLTPESVLEHKQRLAQLDRALDSLSAEQRAVFILYELEGLSLPEIARTLEIALGTATSRLLRGRERFEKWVASNLPTRESP